MSARHAESDMLARSPLTLRFLLESGRDVSYHLSCSCGLLTGLQERLQQTSETESSGHCQRHANDLDLSPFVSLTAVAGENIRPGQQHCVAGTEQTIAGLSTALYFISFDR